MIHYIRRNLTFMCPDCLSDFSGGEESTSPLQTVQISHPRYAGKVKIMSKVEKIELLRLILNWTANYWSLGASRWLPLRASLLQTFHLIYSTPFSLLISTDVVGTFNQLHDDTTSQFSCSLFAV